MDKLMPNLVLTGVPRGGTTLACRLLGQGVDALALFEPMPVHRLPLDHLAASAQVQTYFATVREQVRCQGRAPSKHQDGQVPDNPYGAAPLGQARPNLVQNGEIVVDKPLSARFHLTIKHNAAFLALLDALVPQISVLGVVRHPLAVLASWNSLDLPVSRGRMPAGERLDTSLAAHLDAQPDRLARQLRVLDWCFDQLLRWLPAERVLRYEDIVATNGACLYAAAGVTGAPAVSLHNRNRNAQYDRDGIVRLTEALLAHGGPAVTLYGHEAVETLATTMLVDAGNA